MVWIFYAVLILFGAVGLGLTIFATVREFRSNHFIDSFEAFISSFWVFTAGFCCTSVCVMCTCLVTVVIMMLCGG